MGEGKFWNYENKIVTLFFFSVGFVFFDRLAINYLIPFMQNDFSLTNTQIGLIGSALAITWAISGPLVGYLSDKVNAKRNILIISILLFSVVSLMHGLVATFGLLLVLRLLMGLLEGPIIPITQSVLAVESSEKRRGFNLGFSMNTAQGVFGGFLAPLIIVALANAFDWRTAFYLTIIPGLILAFFIWRYMKEPKTDDKTVISPAAEGQKMGIKQVMGNRNILLSIIIFSCFMVYLMSFQIFGPVFLVNGKGLSESAMSIVMAGFGAGTAILGFVVPAISDRIGRKPATLIFGFLSLFSPIVVLMFDSVALMSVLVFIFSAGMGVGGLAMSVIPTESVPAQYGGFAVGITIGIGEIFGGVLNPVFSGMAADAWGLAAPLMIASSAAFTGFLFSLFLRETAPAKLRANKEKVEKLA
ncbi:MFS transporter [Virgibacillus sediminis]|uniref:MFS transporter n=1 Tax=Virgibacillus sediminis TaxID=202260 RepID=A0ABV7A3G1_9BACI